MAYKCPVCKEIFIESGEAKAWEDYYAKNPNPVVDPIMTCDDCGVKIREIEKRRKAEAELMDFMLNKATQKLTAPKVATKSKSKCRRRR